MHSWESALSCYEFLRKRRLPVSDEAVMSLYLSLRDAADGCTGGCAPTWEMIHPFYSLRLNDADGPFCVTNDARTPTETRREGASQRPPSPLAFLMSSIQHQGTLRPLYHRLRFILQVTDSPVARKSGSCESGGVNNDNNIGSGGENTSLKLSPPFFDAFPALTAPCAIINISLRHNIRKERWIDALRTIHNMHFYNLIEPYLKDLSRVRSRSDTVALLAAVNHDAYYRACVETPSMVLLMDALLVRWESFWDTLKGTTEAQRILTGLLSPPLPSSDVAGEGCKVSKTPECATYKESGIEFEEHDIDTNPLLMRPELEESSLEVLHFVGLTSGLQSCAHEMQLYENQEIYHRLTEATTRIADFALCRRLLTAWTSTSHNDLPEAERRTLPTVVTKQLLLTRLLLRAPSCEVALQVLGEWPTLYFGKVSHSLTPETVTTALRCPEVVAALATRLPPSVFFQEIVKDRLARSSIILGGPARELVREALHRGRFFNEAEEFWMCQVQLELGALCDSEGPNHTGSSFTAIAETFLSQQFSVSQKARFVSGLLRRVGEPRYAYVVDALLCTMVHGTVHNSTVLPPEEGIPLLLAQVMQMWITEDHRPGDAAVLLRQVIHALEKEEPGPPKHHTEASGEEISVIRSNCSMPHVVNTFFKAVARLGLDESDNSRKGRESETALQWLKLLSEVPPTLFEEETLVVWLFWAMRALVQWEDLPHYTVASEVQKELTEKVLSAVRNLSRSLENCETNAVLPPMILNWLASCTGIPWSVATAWIARNAGAETSQGRRFAFIRLPLGPAAFETFTDPQSREKALLAVENELQLGLRSKKLYGWRSTSRGSDDVEQEVRELFNTIRFTLLHAWYCNALHTQQTEKEEKRAYIARAQPSVEPHEQKQHMKRRCKTPNKHVLYSLQETLRVLWEEVPPDHTAACPIHSQGKGC
ncbi:putative protein kinase-like protein [Trypanosoma grayi]|uniref:putative protein kinase-like protein n=1 Tax=Trypanosoma grayi TaxID=71804 RepID=UPI0004F45E93|nr:putative protein kinase-like protein [Trypanosoma grayi]KEG08408.1 putative protein kinase-like protein [Trypanosoma grayi]